MHYKNENTKSDVLVDSQGGGTSLLVRPGESVNLPSSARGDGLVRQVAGFPYSRLVHSDFRLNRAVSSNGMTATAADAAAHPVVLSAGTTYSVWGKIFWTDGGVERQVAFSIRGSGNQDPTPGPGVSTFLIGDVTGATAYPQVNGSSFDAKNGRIQFSWNSSPNGTISAELQFDWTERSPRANYGRDALFVAPLISSTMYMVKSSDEGTTGYVTGSNGQIKQIKEYLSGAQSGDPCRVTTFSYTDDEYPTKATHLRLSEGVLTDIDLPPVQ